MKTAIGNIASYLAVIVWAATLAFVVQCGNIPPLLLIGLVSVGCAAVPGVWHWIRDKRSFGASAEACLFEALGVTGYRLLVFPPLMLIDPVEAANLIHVWLSAAIVFGLLMAGQSLGVRHVLGGICFVFGGALIVYDGLQVWHVLALAGGLVGGWHVAKSAYFEGAGNQASVIGNLTAGAILLLLSFIAGELWNLSLSDLGWLIGLVVVSNAGWLLWIQGVRKGGQRQSKVSALFKPVAAVLWIWLLCGLTLTPVHVASLAAVTVAGLILSPHVFRSAKMARS